MKSLIELKCSFSRLKWIYCSFFPHSIDLEFAEKNNRYRHNSTIQIKSPLDESNKDMGESTWEASMVLLLELLVLVKARVSQSSSSVQPKPETTHH